MLAVALEKISQLIDANADLYQGLNNYRNWFNKTFKNYEIMLEDDWDFENGKTGIEYFLRCLQTLNISVPFAVDWYESTKDAKGVCHLGDYQKTEWLITDFSEFLTQFVQANTELLTKAT